MLLAVSSLHGPWGLETDLFAPCRLPRVWPWIKAAGGDGGHTTAPEKGSAPIGLVQGKAHFDKLLTTLKNLAGQPGLQLGAMHQIQGATSPGVGRWALATPKDHDQA